MTLSSDEQWTDIEQGHNTHGFLCWKMVGNIACFPPVMVINSEGK